MKRFAVLLGLWTVLIAPAAAAEEARAIFAGGCFWCMEPPYDKLDGVIRTTSGYSGGEKPNPTYKEVSSGRSGHIEVVEIVYDPAVVSYEKLLHVFWRNIDPVRANAQFCDVGPQYRSAIFYGNESERERAEASKAELEASGRLHLPIATEILEAAPFYPAESYHQDYYLKNPARYAYYRWGCGRDQRLKEIWGDEAGGH
ncbi:MAG: peptide-methionine (S)-S-oxide reductase MsrA [Parvibaculum sp.]|nr:peptide-methionine (S)-S-oxide reductase MsrA [Parvibaculum sp.]